MDIDALTRSVLGCLLRANIGGGLAIAGVYVACRVFRRIPAAMHYALYCLSCAKMILLTFM